MVVVLYMYGGGVLCLIIYYMILYEHGCMVVVFL